jgi:hypothetical protein
MRIALRERLKALRSADLRVALGQLLRGLAFVVSRGWAAALGVIIGVVLFSSAGHDDSHITLWSAYVLAETGEIVNHAGARVEQSSSLLHTVVLALSYLVTGIALPWLVYFIGIVFFVLTVVRISALGKLTSTAGPLRLAVGTAPVLTYWAVGGLETTLFCWVAIEFLIHSCRILERESVTRRDWIAPLTFSGLLALTRPEASMVAICALAAVLPFAWRRGRKTLGVASSLLFAAILFAGFVLVWRRWYFGEPFPHPVTAKIGSPGSDLSWQVWTGAVQLYGVFVRAHGFPLLLGLVAGVAGLWGSLKNRDIRRPLITAFAGAYLSFVVCVGGDWMFGERFIAHVVPLLLLMLFIHLGVEGWPRARAWTLAIALGLVHVLSALHFSAKGSMGRPIWIAWQVLPAIKANAAPREFAWVEFANKPHGRDAMFLKELDPIIDRIVASEGDVSVLSVQGGMVMYYVATRHYPNVEFIDQSGLTSRHYDDVAEELQLTRDHFGLDWDLRDVLRLADTRSGPEYQPDVIFDLYRSSRRSAEREGYVVVFEQEGSLRSAYTEPEPGQVEEDEEEEEAEEPEMEYTTREERMVQDMRDQFEEERGDRKVRFFTAKKGMYQFIAVRKDLALKLGWARVEKDEDGRPRGRPRTKKKRFKWDKIRREHLRFFDEDESSSDDE